MIYDHLGEFHALKMEEHTSVDLHLAKIHRIHRHLILEFDHEIPDPFKEFVMGGEMVTFHELVARVRSLKVDCIKGDIVNPIGICDIQML
jgi:L-ribulose-5-phosphate 3-epimerase UlaE